MKKRTKRIVLLSAVATFLVVAVVTTVIIVVVSGSKNKFEGIWHSDNNTISHQFYEDGKVKTTFNNAELPVINTKYTGSFEGVYAYDKSEEELSITLNIYSKEITMHYTYALEDNVLILTDSSTDKSEKYILKEID